MSNTAPTLVVCKCGRHVPRAPGYLWFQVSHVCIYGRHFIPCENTGLHSGLDQALNMEQLLRDVESW